MKTIAVIFGSKSTEHDVSIVTAIASIIKPLQATKLYNVMPVYISKEGVWYVDKKLGQISLYSTGKIDDFLKNARPAQLDLTNGLSFVVSSKYGRNKRINVDVAFPATHGTYGEDGSLMGLLRMAGVPFVGCDMEASVVAMNKLLSHQVIEAAGVKSHPYVGMKKSAYTHDKTSAIATLTHLRYPLFVKPVHLGSSIGITRVDDEGALEAALDVAFLYDDTAIIEEAIPNLIEVTVPIIGFAGNSKAGLVERPLFSSDETFDFDKKYMQQGKGGKSGKASGSQGYSELPAKLNKHLYEKAESLAKTAYDAIGCSGIARIDLLINGSTQEVYFNEVNPLPGSLYAHNWRMAGVSNIDLVNDLIQYAEKRAARQAKVSTSFSTNFLKQF